MIEPSKPRNEAERLAALHGLHILDTPREERFDRITRLATELFGVPTAFIALVDDERVWYKSKEGLERDELPRCDTFCGHAILDPMRATVVNDAARDERFHDNPCVQGRTDSGFTRVTRCCRRTAMPWEHCASWTRRGTPSATNRSRVCTIWPKWPKRS